jgi:predicted enzyme related to lactoylglutathione lyase
MANPITWFEIIGPDASALHRFYRDALGWKLTPPVKEMGNYSMVEDHEPGIGGGIGEGPTRVSVYLETSDPQRLLDRALAAGAMLLMPVTTITPTTTIAMFTDPAGNTVGLLKANPRPARAARPRAKAARPRAKKKPAKRTRTTTANRTKRTTKRAKRRY